MYDVSGTDTGREWVEMYNDGAAALDVSAYKLFENNTNHALLLVSGTGVVQPGGAAVIADDAAKFMADNPSFSGTLFSSSFSLSNSGETLSLKDGALAVADSVSYDGSMGAAGDGNSLVRSGGNFIAASPTPGSHGSFAPAPVPSSATASSSSAAAANAPAPMGASIPAITLRLTGDELVMVGGGSFFSAEAYGTQGLPLQGARFIWNFGDGTTAEGKRVFHAYAYPGTYSLSVTAAHNYSSAVERTSVTAVAAQVSLTAMEDGSLLIRNLSKSDLDIGLWALIDGGATYVIPEDTVVLAGEGVRFSPAVTRLHGSASALLRYPNDAIAAAAAPSPASPLRGERVSAAQLQSMRTPVVSAPLQRVEDAPAPTQESSQAAAVAAAGSGTMLWGSVAALVVLLGVAAAGTRYLQSLGVERETLPRAEEFEIE